MLSAAHGSKEPVDALALVGIGGAGDTTSTVEALVSVFGAHRLILVAALVLHLAVASVAVIIFGTLAIVLWSLVLDAGHDTESTILALVPVFGTDWLGVGVSCLCFGLRCVFLGLRDEIAVAATQRVLSTGVFSVAQSAKSALGTVAVVGPYFLTIDFFSVLDAASSVLALIAARGTDTERDGSINGFAVAQCTNIVIYALTGILFRVVRVDHALSAVLAGGVAFLADGEGMLSLAIRAKIAVGATAVVGVHGFVVHGARVLNAHGSVLALAAARGANTGILGIYANVTVAQSTPVAVGTLTGVLGRIIFDFTGSAVETRVVISRTYGLMPLNVGSHGKSIEVCCCCCWM